MAEVTQQQVVDYIKGISVIELSQLVKTLEQELGVSAAAAVAVAAPAAGGAAAAEEKTEKNIQSGLERERPACKRRLRSVTRGARGGGERGKRRGGCSSHRKVHPRPRLWRQRQQLERIDNVPCPQLTNGRRRDKVELALPPGELQSGIFVVRGIGGRGVLELIHELSLAADRPIHASRLVGAAAPADHHVGTLARAAGHSYVLVVTGFVMAMAALGIDLTKVTLLAGALGVGVNIGTGDTQSRETAAGVVLTVRLHGRVHELLVEEFANVGLRRRAARIPRKFSSAASDRTTSSAAADPREREIRLSRRFRRREGR